MANKTKKSKLNGKMKRRMRKTTAVVLLISSLVVAAIPVPEAAAAQSSADYGTNVSVAEPYEDQDHQKSNISNDASSFPVVQESDTIFCSENGEFQFAYIPQKSGDSTYVAVLVGYSYRNLVNGNLVIPQKLNAYKQYTYSQGTGHGYVAATLNGNALYYKLVTKNIETTERDPDTGAVKYRNSASEDEFVETNGFSGDTIRNSTENEDSITYYTYRYEPCLDTNIDTWDISGAKLYTYKDNTGDLSVDTQLKYCFDSQIVTNGTGAGGLVSPNTYHAPDEKFVAGDRLVSANVSYISSMHVETDSNGKWIAKPTTSDNPTKGVFADNGHIQSVTIPNTIWGVGDYAFYGCASLKTAIFDDAIRVIGESAFENCKELTSVGLSKNSNISFIAQKAFKGCENLSGFTFSVNNRTIGDEAFANCYGLTNLDFDSATQLSKFGCDVFMECRSLQKVVLPKNLENVGKGTFKRCISLEEVIFPDNYTKNIPISIFQGVYDSQYGKKLKHIKIPSMNSTVVNSEPLSSAYKYGIPSFMEEVNEEFYFEGYDNGAIHGTTKVNEIAFKYLDNGFDNRYEKIIDDGNGNKCTYWVNDQNELTYVGIDGNGDNIQIPEKIGPYFVSKIGSDFKNNTAIKSITIPTTVSEIADNAFAGCSNLKKVTFSEPNALTYIGTDAFKTTSSDLTFEGEMSNSSLPFQYAMNPDNTYTSSTQNPKYIDFASGYPTYLHASYNPSKGKAELTKVPVIDSEEFKNNVDDAITNSSQTTLNYETAKSLYSTSPSSLPTNVKDVFDAAYHIVIPSGVQCFQDELFSNAGSKDTSNNDTNKLNGSTYAEKAYKKDNVTANKDLLSVTMYDVEEVPAYAFYGCDKLESVTMLPSNNPAGESIGNYAFGQCSELQSVTLPMTTDTVGLRPFAGDKKLTDVRFSNDIVDGVIPGSVSVGNAFAYDNGILFSLSGGVKDKVVECLETRGNNSASSGNSIGSTTINKSELEGITDFYDEAFMDCDGIGTVDMSLSNLTKVPKFCFANSDNLSYVTVNNGCSELEEYSFKDVPLKSIVIPSTVTLFDTSAFYTKDANENYVTNSVEVVTSEGSAAEKLAKAYSKYYWTLGESINPVFTVTFVDNDGKTVIDKQTVEAGEDAVDPTKKSDITMPEHEGLYFTKWDRDFTAVGMDMWVQAVYEEVPDQTWTVKFYNWNMDLIVERTVPDGGDAEEPKTPTRDGYKFTGWSKPFTNVTSDVDTMALFDYVQTSTSPTPTPGSGGSSNNNNDNDSKNEKTYTVTVINGSGSGSYVKGATVIVSAYAPNTGYQFYNWTSSSSSVTFTSPTLSATSFKMPDKDVTITANYITTSVSGNNVTNNKTQGTVTSSSSSNTGKPSGNAQQTSSNSGTQVEVNKNGISDKNVASASVNGSTDNFVVKVTESAAATEAVAKALKNEYTTLDNIRYFAMDIALYDETGKKEVTDTSGLSVTITLPIPDELRPYGGNNKVAGVVNGDRLDKLNPKFTTIDGIPCVTFTATHFSPYTVYVDTANLVEGVADSTPKTGDFIHPKWFLAVGLFCLSIVLFLKRDKRYQVEVVH